MDYVKNISDRTCKLDMHGEFTFADHVNFKEVIALLNDHGVQQLDLNLSKVEFVDSAALGMFLLIRDEAKKAGKKVSLISPQGQVKKMFEISRFYDIFDVKS